MNTKNPHAGKEPMLLDAVATPIVISRLSDSTILYANPALLQTGCYSAEQLIGGRTSNYFVNHADQDQIAEILNQKGYLSDFETQLRRGDGSLYWALLSAHIIDYDDQVCVLSSYIDITERKQAEQTLRENETRLKSVFNNLQDAFYRTDADGHFSWISPSTANLLGYDSTDDLVGKSVAETIYAVPEERVQFLQALSEKGRVADYEVTLKRRDGSHFNVSTNSAFYYDNTNQVAGVEGVFRDITERKQAEAQLRESEVRYHLLSEATTEGIAIHDKGIVLDVNQVCSTMFGYELAEIIGMLATDFFTPESREIVANNIRSGYEKPYEVMGLRKDGTTFPVELTGKSVPYQGHIARITVLRDLTQSKFVERRLSESEERYRRLSEASVEGIVIHDKGILLDANELFAEMFGYEHSEVIGMLAMDFLTPETREITAQNIRSGYEKPYEVMGLRKDSSTFPVEITGKQIPFEGRIVRVSALRDITERKRLEEEVQTAFERRGRQVQVSTQVAQSIAAATSLEDLYQRVVTQVKEQFGYYHTQLLRYDAVQDTVALVQGYGETGEKMLAAGHHLPMGKGLIGTAAETGETMMRPTLENDSDWQPHPLLPNTKGEIAVPIKLGDKILGVLDVQSNTAGALNRDDQLLLEGLCGQIAVSIESTRLSQEMAERLQEINRLYQAMSREGWQSYWQTTTIPLGFMYDQGGLREVKETAPAGEQFVEVPLAVPGGEVIGNLVIADDLQRPMSAEDKDFVQQVSEQVALALESARLFEQTQAALASTQDSETKLADALDIAKEALDLAKLAHWEFDLEKDLFTFNDQFYSIFRTTAEKAGGYQLSSAKYTELFVHPEDAPLVGVEIGKALASTERHFSSKLEHRVVFADGTPGYISVEVHVERDENGKIIRWYGANQDVTERRMAQELITKRARDLAAVSEISSASTRELDIEKLLETVVHLTQRKFGLYHAHVFTFNELSNTLEIKACGWKEGGEHEGTHGTTMISLTQEQSLVARAGRTREPIIVNDVHGEPGWLPNPLLPDTQAEMAVPMIIGDQLLGVLDVQSEKLNAFSQEDASIQTTLASQIATALQNARSFEQAQRQAERESRLNIISQKIQSATTVEAVLQIAARELGHTLGAPLTIAQLGLKEKPNGNQ